MSLFLNGSWWSSSAGKARAGSWTPVAVVFDGANVSFFLNGISDVSVNAAGSYASTTSGSLYLGSSAFSGSLDEVAIYGSALPASRLQAPRLSYLVLDERP